jgi:two-component system alkaline phosphatase synthesis response regulator PhoP
MDRLARILLIDDDVDQHVLLRTCLPALTLLDWAATEQEALVLLKKEKYDLLIIDLNLTNETGFSFLEKIKKLALAIDAIKIILTASEKEDDQVASYKLEVDDFINKPIRPKAFTALIEKHLKKRILSNIWMKGRLRIEISMMTVEGKNDQGEYSEIILTPKEFKILIRLINRPGQVFSREQIFEGAWGEEDENSLRSIDTHISALRKKISLFGVRLTSIRGVGYKIELNEEP